MKKTLTQISILGASLVPFFATAQAAFVTINNIINQVGTIISRLIPITFALGILFFIYGLAKFIFSAGDPEAHESGRNVMIWGLVALFVMASMYGIIQLATQTLGIQPGGNIPIPNYPILNTR